MISSPPGAEEDSAAGCSSRIDTFVSASTESIVSAASSEGACITASVSSTVVISETIVSGKGAVSLGATSGAGATTNSKVCSASIFPSSGLDYADSGFISVMHSSATVLS